MDHCKTTVEEMQAQILQILNRHALEAQNSQYDRSVSITAIATARDHFNQVAVESSAEAYCQRVLADLITLQETYNDPDGEYTNGRGVLGSLIGDICLLISRTDS